MSLHIIGCGCSSCHVQIAPQSQRHTLGAPGGINSPPVYQYVDLTPIGIDRLFENEHFKKALKKFIFTDELKKITDVGE